MNALLAHIYHSNQCIETHNQFSIHSLKMSDVNTAYVWNNSLNKFNNAYFLPKNLRALICGKSSCGKTVLVLHLLLEPNVLDYDSLILCGNSLHQDQYCVLQSGLEKKLSKNQIRAIFEHQEQVEECGGVDRLLSQYKGECKGKNIISQFYTNIDDLPDPKTLDVNRKHLLVLDDCMLSRQNKAEAYYTRGRHNRCQAIYITQNYFKLPRSSVRECASFIIFFRQDYKNLSHIFSDHCTEDEVTFQQFSKFCHDVWKENDHNFVTSDNTRPVNCGRFRKNLNHYWSPLYEKLKIELLSENKSVDSSQKFHSKKRKRK